jgi:hypothetical protein
MTNYILKDLVKLKKISCERKVDLENKVLILRVKIDYMLSTVYDCLIEIKPSKV